MKISDEVRKQVGKLMVGIGLPGVTADNLIQTALQIASAKNYQEWEKKVGENDVQGAKVCYTFYEAFSALYRDSFKG